MRIGVALGHDAWPGLHGEAAAVEEAGLDCCLLRGPGAIAAAAALAGVTTHLRVIVDVADVEDAFETAEQLAVCDLLLGGRLVAVTAADCTAALRAALGRVAPAPAQLVLPVWRRDDLRVHAVRLDAGADAIAEEVGDGDVAILELLDDDRLAAIAAAGRRLRPRLQGVRLPPDLLASWD